MPGAIDVAYDRRSHVASLWFSPAHVPAVKFTPIGDFDVDEKGYGRLRLGGCRACCSCLEAQAWPR